MVAPNEPARPRFPLGKIVATPGALQALAVSQESPIKFLRRHVAGDWGEVDEEDGRANDHAIVVGLRILSAYKTERGQRLWIITESDRSVTTLLLPEEY
jgi:hypothetical protein